MFNTITVTMTEENPGVRIEISETGFASESTLHPTHGHAVAYLAQWLAEQYEGRLTPPWAGE